MSDVRQQSVLAATRSNAAGTHSDIPKMYQTYERALAISKVLKLTGIGHQTVFRFLMQEFCFLAQVLKKPEDQEDSVLAMCECHHRSHCIETLSKKAHLISTQHVDHHKHICAVHKPKRVHKSFP